MKKRQIILELTPLLDVILILLFAVLIQSRLKVAASSDQVRETKSEQALVEQELNETKKELARIKNRQISLGVVEENSLILTMTVDASGVHRVLIDTDEESQYVSLEEARLDTASERIYTALKDTIEASGKNTVFLVFQYDRDVIYHQEYELVSEAVEEIKALLEEEGIHINYIEVDVSSSAEESE